MFASNPVGSNPITVQEMAFPLTQRLSLHPVHISAIMARGALHSPGPRPGPQPCSSAQGTRVSSCFLCCHRLCSNGWIPILALCMILQLSGMSCRYHHLLKFSVDSKKLIRFCICLLDFHHCHHWYIYLLSSIRAISPIMLIFFRDFRSQNQLGGDDRQAERRRCQCR